MSCKDSKYVPGGRIAGWTLRKCLGSGGQGEVWLAARNGNECALKLLTNAAGDSEAFRRFGREVATLRLLGDRPGIVPLVDADITADPPWLAMPVAVPIAEFLQAKWELRRVVAGMATVAATLHELFEERQISHRDLHPGNLFVYRSAWCVGDFGLVRVPKVPKDAAITKPDDVWARARSFIAPEMIDFPATAAGEPADAYSVAKSLWALAAQKSFPPSGPIDASDEGWGNLPQNVTDEPRWRFVLLLLEAATRDKPGDRPTLDQISDELRQWLDGSLGSLPPQTIDFGPHFWDSVTGLDPFERRQLVRTLFLLDADIAHSSLNGQQVLPGEWWVTSSAEIRVSFELSGGKKRLLACMREGKDPNAELFAGFSQPQP